MPSMLLAIFCIFAVQGATSSCANAWDECTDTCCDQSFACLRGRCVPNDVRAELQTVVQHPMPLLRSLAITPQPLVVSGLSADVHTVSTPIPSTVAATSAVASSSLRHEPLSGCKRSWSLLLRMGHEDYLLHRQWRYSLDMLRGCATRNVHTGHPRLARAMP